MGFEVEYLLPLEYLAIAVIGLGLPFFFFNWRKTVLTYLLIVGALIGCVVGLLWLITGSFAFLTLENVWLIVSISAGVVGVMEDLRGV